jgi:hypothetical protein
LIVEDLHWCDGTSVDFLRLLDRRITTLPILLLATYRSDEVPSHLRQFLWQLEQGGWWANFQCLTSLLFFATLSLDAQFNGFHERISQAGSGQLNSAVSLFIPFFAQAVCASCVAT